MASVKRKNPCVNENYFVTIFRRIWNFSNTCLIKNYLDVFKYCLYSIISFFCYFILFDEAQKFISQGKQIRQKVFLRKRLFCTTYLILYHETFPFTVFSGGIRRENINIKLFIYFKLNSNT